MNTTNKFTNFENQKVLQLLPASCSLLSPFTSLLSPSSSLLSPSSSLLSPSCYLLSAFCFLLSVFSLHAATPNASLGTFIVSGAVKDGDNKVLAGDSGTLVRAVDSNGKVVAETTVGTANSAGRNFLLEVPITTRATDESAIVGSDLSIVFVKGGETLVAAEKVRVTGVADVNTSDYMFLPVTVFTKDDGSGETVRIPTEYLETVEPWLDGRTYDPWGDDDGDGQSNYLEFLAETHPFDASDALRVRKFAPGGAGHQITFEYVGGHAYGVAVTPSLVKPSWAKAAVKLEPNGTPGERVLPPPNVENGVGVTTIYVVPTEGAKQEFFKLEAR